MTDHLRVPVDQINLEAIDHLAGVITDRPLVDRRGMLKRRLTSPSAGPMGGDRVPYLCVMG
jgi:hypothetical protein